MTAVDEESGTVMYRKLKHKGRVHRWWYQDTLTVFAVGCLIGVALAVTVHHFSDDSKYQTSVWQYYLSPSKVAERINSYLSALYDPRYERWLSHTFGGVSLRQDPDQYRFTDVGGSKARPR